MTAPSSHDASPPDTVRSRAVRGGAWVLGGYVASEGLRLFANLVLARLLAPEAFGLMALVNTIRMGLNMMGDLGVRSTVVQSPRGDEPEFANTIFTFQAARAVALWLACCGLAPLAGWFYGDARLIALLPVAGLTVLLGGLESMSLARLQRQLRVGWLIAAELLDVSITVAVMLAWASVAPSVWALVIGGVIGGVSRVLLSHALARGRRDRFAWDRSAIRDVLHLGKWLFASTLLTFAAGQSDRLIFGRLIDLGSLGVYNIAAMLASPLVVVVARIGRTVAFPSLSEVARRSESAFRDAYVRSTRALLPVAGAAVSVLVASGPCLVSSLYDSRYQDAGWIVQWLALSGWLYAAGALGGEALLARGEASWLAFANGAKAVAIPIFMWIGFRIAGFPGAVAGFAASELARCVVFGVGRSGIGIGNLAVELALSAQVLAAAGLGLVASRAAASAGGDLLGFAAGVAVAGACWLPNGWRIYRTELGGAAPRRAPESGAQPGRES